VEDVAFEVQRTIAGGLSANMDQWRLLRRAGAGLGGANGTGGAGDVLQVEAEGVEQDGLRGGGAAILTGLGGVEVEEFDDVGRMAGGEAFLLFGFFG